MPLMVKHVLRAVAFGAGLLILAISALFMVIYRLAHYRVFEFHFEPKLLLIALPIGAGLLLMRYGLKRG